MDPQAAAQGVELWHMVGVSIGGALASFVATWLTLFRSVKGTASSASERLALLEAEQKRTLKRIENVEGKADAAVTKEEFAAFSTSTSQSITSFGEKVGVLTGYLRGSREK